MRMARYLPLRVAFGTNAPPANYTRAGDPRHNAQWGKRTNILEAIPLVISEAKPAGRADSWAEPSTPFTRAVGSMKVPVSKFETQGDRADRGWILGDSPNCANLR